MQSRILYATRGTPPAHPPTWRPIRRPGAQDGCQPDSAHRFSHGDTYIILYIVAPHRPSLKAAGLCSNEGLPRRLLKLRPRGFNKPTVG